MNILPSAKLPKMGKPTYRKIYRSDGSRQEVKNPRGGGFSGLHGAIVVKGVPNEFRGFTAGRYEAAPGVSFEQATAEGL